MRISHELLDYVQDGDLQTKLENVPYSTDLRSVVTVGFMIQRHEKSATAATVGA